MRHPRHPSRGQALVEFAIVAPLFFLLLFTLIEFGRAVYYIQILNNAAREGARYAIVHGADAGCPSGPWPPAYGINPCDPIGLHVEGAVKDYAIGIIDAVPADFVVTRSWCKNAGKEPCSQPENSRGSTVSVSVQYTFRPWLAAIVPLPTFTLTGGSTLVVNH
ncbi:MAG: TadE/TadG family type IV pilus assembly protein [Candidatus Limnocylindrales bacterium]